ncbi:MAG: hypothetical protein M3384_07345 [Acidobacteriota bacterium]|nr:hypothetical protein [Acidobacteriota bacterium]
MKKFRGQIQISFRYSQHLGPRFDAAGVTLRLETADSYKFADAAQWDFSNYSGAVERGVREALIESGCDPESGIHVTLQEIDYDYVNSSEFSFYIAARCAVKSRFMISEIRNPIDLIK